jgi:hypothetical protein
MCGFESCATHNVVVSGVGRGTEYVHVENSARAPRDSTMDVSCKRSVGRSFYNYEGTIGMFCYQDGLVWDGVVPVRSYIHLWGVSSRNRKVKTKPTVISNILYY